MKDVGKYIRDKRNGHISLRGFAKKLYISPAYLSDIERNLRPLNKKMLTRICCELARIGAGELHNLHHMMLLLSGQMTAERTSLLGFWETFKDMNADEQFKNWEMHAYKALYDEIDIAFYGRPLRKGKEDKE